MIVKPHVGKVKYEQQTTKKIQKKNKDQQWTRDEDAYPKPPSLRDSPSLFKLTTSKGCLLSGIPQKTDILGTGLSLIRGNLLV